MATDGDWIFDSSDAGGNPDQRLPSRHATARLAAVVVLRCGAGRHRHPPRVGEVFNYGVLMVRIGPSGRAWTVTLKQPSPFEWGRGMRRSVRFPCGQRLEGGRRCPADWNVDATRLEAAYRRAVAERKRELMLGVDL
jgi:hypothetical protein